VLANIKSAGGMKGSVNASGDASQSFTQKRLRVQSAVNTRGREIAQVKQEKEEMDLDLKRHEIELAETKQRNDEIRQLI